MMASINGIAVSGGKIKGPALTLPSHDLRLDFTPCAPAQLDHQWQRFQDALTQAESQLELLHQQAQEKLGDDIAALFVGLHLLVTDPELVEEVRRQIFDKRARAEAAVYQVLNEQARTLVNIGDDYLAERAADLRELASRLVHLLQGRMPPDHILLEDPVILLADELYPAQLTLLDNDKLLGIVTRKGGRHSHAAILARAFGIPALAGCEAMDRVSDGDWLALDGDQGLLFYGPALPDFPTCRQEALAGEAEVIPAASPIALGVNISTLLEARKTPGTGASSVGLCRTELLFPNRQQAPGLERQVQIYQHIARECAPAVVTFRLLDAGGDKPLPWLGKGSEPNPALGWHGIRVLLDNPQLLDTQLQALLEVSRQYPLRIMIPMVSELDEVLAVKDRLATLAGQMALPCPPLGAMVETPSAAMLADVLAEEVDFFSIGSNDLAQYTLAVDRENPKVADRLNAVSPALVRLMARVVDAAQPRSLPVTLCGELAASPDYLPLWLGLGLTGLSMQASALPAIRQRLVTPVALPERQALLGCRSTAELSALLQKA
ncbi:phosphoenolpyruvate--protein phosphotransferase [Gallaecimonas xiamenensis]|uniref:Phosphoenolpyruvate-protein phosphotransferase n=1 Tax=Gallaecimonas xiamenensis 3-C-1 TaxID=745411 RepID=K2J039_9GAMM|nr:phosphoenolpyruvate--protein phosphotransferase [Gallaecimonas xiamenensis]EKE76206.1 phosphoenolpyruvate-protein phosphotransferase [Gallaecimonas xiamenensis 3-C-1]